MNTLTRPPGDNHVTTTDDGSSELAVRPATALGTATHAHYHMASVLHLLNDRLGHSTENNTSRIFTGQMPSCHPTNTAKALKETQSTKEGKLTTDHQPLGPQNDS